MQEPFLEHPWGSKQPVAYKAGPHVHLKAGIQTAPAQFFFKVCCDSRTGVFPTPLWAFPTPAREAAKEGRDWREAMSGNSHNPERGPGLAQPSEKWWPHLGSCLGLGMGCREMPSSPASSISLLRLQQLPPPQAPHNCFPMLLMEARLLMPKPWVGGGWVRTDQGSQGRKLAQRPPNFSTPSVRMGKGRGLDTTQEF